MEPKHDLDPEVAAQGSYIAMDFEFFAPGQLLPFPYKKNGINLYADPNGNYFPYCTDATRNMVVRGPRSIGLDTIQKYGQFPETALQIEFDDSAAGIWLSLIKTDKSQHVITCTVYDTNGKFMRDRDLNFDKTDESGTYRTFFIPGMIGGMPIKRVLFKKGIALLVRVAASIS